MYPIKIDYERDNRLTDYAKTLVKKHYMLDSEKSPQEAFARASIAFSGGDMGLAQRIYDYVSNQWLMFASPILSNAPCPVTGYWNKGLPISCFLTHVSDSLDSLISHTEELRWLSVKGGGVGGHWSDVRAVSDKAPGVIPFLKTVDADMTAYKQGRTRKGSYAAFLDISHPDIIEFINFRKPTGGDIDRKCLNLHHGVNLTDEFMEAVIHEKDWNLVDPHTGEVRYTINALDLFLDILDIRSKTGEPFFVFIDEANRKLPEAMKKHGLKINGSNLCVHGDTEILTENGYKKISSLEGKQVSVWNGEEFSKVTVMKTGTNQDMIRISFSNGESLVCTPYHKFYLQDGTEVEAKDLKEGSKLLEFSFPTDKAGDVQRISVTSVSDGVVEVGDTFCFTEPKRHMGVFNGVLTGQCTEIFLPTSDSLTAVCCLSSLNLEYFDEWKDTRIVKDLVEFLNNVLDFFIEHADKKKFKKAIESASKERSIGIGALGFHSYLQNNLIPFESMEATGVNYQMFKHIKAEAEEATKELAKRDGGCYYDNTRRNMHLLAIAPNANSGIIAGSSASIEPILDNYHTQRTRIGTRSVRNRHLEEYLKSIGKNTEEVWMSILENDGDVEHLDFLNDRIKEVFKPADKIDQHWVVDHAAKRQEFICQGQSVNLFFPNGSLRSYVLSVHLAAWKSGLKSVYYYRTKSLKSVEGLQKSVERQALSDYSECISCEG